MLQLQGKVLGVTSENRQGGPSGTFVQTTIHVLDGFDKYEARVGREIMPEQLPKEGDEVTLGVSVSAFARKSGAAEVQLTAEKVLSNGAPGLRKAV